MGRFYDQYGTLATTVTTAWATILSLKTNRGQAGDCNIEIDNVGGGGVALTALRIQLKDHPDGEWYTFLEDTDFASSSIWNLMFAGTSDGSAVYQLADTAQAYIHMRLNASFAMRVQAKTGSTGTIDARANVLNNS